MGLFHSFIFEVLKIDTYGKEKKLHYLRKGKHLFKEIGFRLKKRLN